METLMHHNDEIFRHNFL